MALPNELGLVESPFRKKGLGTAMAEKETRSLAKKETSARPWTATDLYKLKGLAKRNVGVEKIARALKRSVAETTAKAASSKISFQPKGQSSSAHSDGPTLLDGNVSSRAVRLAG
jgi:hypothetical protein